MLLCSNTPEVTCSYHVVKSRGLKLGFDRIVDLNEYLYLINNDNLDAIRHVIVHWGSHDTIKAFNLSSRLQIVLT